MDPKDTLRAIRSLIDVALGVHVMRVLHVMLEENRGPQHPGCWSAPQQRLWASGLDRSVSIIGHNVRHRHQRGERHEARLATALLEGKRR
jgi:hypothetical protein